MPMSTAGYAAVAAGEDWHYVGEAGEPAFQNGWGNLTTEPALAFRRREAGVIDLQGKIHTTGFVNTEAFTLPTGYRPSAETGLTAYGVITGSPDQFVAVWVQVDANGSVTPTGDADTVFMSGQFFLDPPVVA